MAHLALQAARPPALLLALGLALAHPAARAVDVDAQDLKPYCEPAAYFKINDARTACVADATAIQAITNPALCKGDALKWTAAVPPAANGSCEAVTSKNPTPICNPQVPNLKYSAGKCKISTTPEFDKADEFFKDWVVGLAIIQPNVPSVREASIVNGRVRVSQLVRNETSLLVARQFFPWNPGSKCTNLVTDSWRNCFGLMVAAASPTTGAGSGQLINFIGGGLSMGGSVSGFDRSSFGVGIGIGRKLNTRVLGEGFADGQEPPVGETQIRYRDIDVEAKFVYIAVRW
jgi:hypothetical protein